MSVYAPVKHLKKIDNFSDWCLRISFLDEEDTHSAWLQEMGTYICLLKGISNLLDNSCLSLVCFTPKQASAVSSTSCKDYCLSSKGGSGEEQMWTDNNSNQAESSDHMLAWNGNQTARCERTVYSANIILYLSRLTIQYWQGLKRFIKPVV